MLDLTDFYAGSEAPPGCAMKAAEGRVVISAGSTTFELEKGRLRVRWYTGWTGDQMRVRPVGEVVGVSSRADQRSAAGLKTLRLEVTFADGQTIAPMIRRPPKEVRWVKARLQEVLGHAPVEPPLVIPGLEDLPVIGRGKTVRGGVDANGATTLRLGMGRPCVALRVDPAGERLTAAVVGSGADRSFEWVADSIFSIASGSSALDPSVERAIVVTLCLMDGRRVGLTATPDPAEADEVVGLLNRALRLPGRRERARRFLESGEGVIGVAARRGPRDCLTLPAGAPVPLPYARLVAPPVLVTRAEGALTVAVPPEPAAAAWLRGLMRFAPWFAVLAVVGGAIGFSAGVPLWVFPLACCAATAVWFMAAAEAGVGRHVLITVTAEDLAWEARGGPGGTEDRRWRADDVRSVSVAARKLHVSTASGGQVLLRGRPDVDLKHLARVVNAALGLLPPPHDDR